MGSAIPGVLIPLLVYMKLKLTGIESHPTRQEIRNLIESKPGIHFTEIVRGLSLANGNATHHLGVMERNGYIRSRKIGTHKCYFPPAYDVHQLITIASLTDVQKRILNTVAERTTEGISETDLANLLGLSQQRVNYNVRILKGYGLITIQRKGKRCYCYLTGDFTQRFPKEMLEKHLIEMPPECQRCGTMLRKQAHFCDTCGIRLTRDQTADHHDENHEE